MIIPFLLFEILFKIFDLLLNTCVYKTYISYYAKIKFPCFVIVEQDQEMWCFYAFEGHKYIHSLCKLIVLERMSSSTQKHIFLPDVIWLCMCTVDVIIRDDGNVSFTCRGSFFNRSKIFRCEVLSAGLDKCNVTRYRESVYSTPVVCGSPKRSAILLPPRSSSPPPCQALHDPTFHSPSSLWFISTSRFRSRCWPNRPVFFSQIPYTTFEVHRFSLRLPFPLSCNLTRYWIKQTNLHPKDLESYVRSSKKSMHKTYKLAGKAMYPGGKNASYHVRRHFRNDHVYTCLLRSSWIRAIWDPVWSSLAIWIDAK